MIVISEYEMSEDIMNQYIEKGIKFYYGYENFKIGAKESVGIYLETLYKSTIDLIERLLYFKHKVTLKYKDKTYKLNCLEDLKQPDKDAYIILYDYNTKREAYFENIKLDALKRQYTDVSINYKEVPEDEMDNFVQAFARLYQLDIDYSNKLDVIKAYYQLKYYLENDIPYSNEPIGINPADEPMFSGIKFKTFYEEPIEETSFGDETYFEDYIYKNM